MEEASGYNFYFELRNSQTNRARGGEQSHLCTELTLPSRALASHLPRTSFWQAHQLLVTLGKPLQARSPAPSSSYQFSVYKDFTTTCSSLLVFLGQLHLGGSTLVAEELWVHTKGGSVSLALWLLDTVSVLLGGLVVGRVVLWLCHFYLAHVHSAQILVGISFHEIVTFELSRETFVYE